MKLKFDHYQFNRTDSNGVPVYWKNLPWVNGFAYIHIIVSLGARQDPENKEGLAHFLEHMLFNGCAGFPTQEEVKKVSRRLLMDSLNAGTNFECTEYSCKIKTDKLEEAIRFLRSFILSPTLDSKDIERERQAIVREIWEKYANKLNEELHKKIQKMKYGSHAFGRQDRAFGWHDTVEKITEVDLRTFFSEYYRRDNFSILIAGDITKEILSQLSILTESIPKGSAVDKIRKVTSWPAPDIKEFCISVSEYMGLKGAAVPEKASIGVFRPMPIQENDHVSPLTRELIWHLLFDRIRGEFGTTYSPQTWGNLFRDHCHAGISVDVAPDAVQKTKEILSGTLREIAAGNTGHLPLFKELKSVALEKKLSLDVSGSRIADNAADELGLTGSITSNEQDTANLSRVEYEDVSKLLKSQFAEDQLFWSITLP